MAVRIACNIITSIARRHTPSGGYATQFKGAHFSTTGLKLQDKCVNVTFVLSSGQRITTQGKVGDTLLDVVVNNDLPIDGYGACEGTLTCSTCHVILKPEDFKRIENEPLDEEQDMLELAYGLTDTSRLGCQITLTPNLEGLEVQIPDSINDQRS